jgi:butyrate kinase
VFDGEIPLLNLNIRHTQEELEKLTGIQARKEFRLELILDALEQNKTALESIDGVIAIGGLLKPGDGGVYIVTQDMVQDLETSKYGAHAANLGALLAVEIASKRGFDAYIADPITTDEMQEKARLSGMPEITRSGRAHTLNQKSIAAKAAADLGKDYSQVNMVVVHLGGGISVVAHRQGRMVDTNSARGEGPFCMDRTGGLNSFELAQLCTSGKYAGDEILKKINGDGGVVAYLGTRDFKEVIGRRAGGDQKAAAVYDAMAYQVAKEIGAMAVVLQGKVDAIVFTGGMANNREFTDAISAQVSFLGNIMVYPGEQEMEALAKYLSEVQSGKREAFPYTKEES